MWYFLSCNASPISCDLLHRGALPCFISWRLHGSNSFLSILPWQIRSYICCRIDLLTSFRSLCSLTSTSSGILAICLSVPLKNLHICVEKQGKMACYSSEIIFKTRFIFRVVYSTVGVLLYVGFAPCIPSKHYTIRADLNLLNLLMFVLGSRSLSPSSV